MSDKIQTLGFLIHSLSSGGAERVMVNLCNHLSQQHKVVLITLVQQPSFYTLKKEVHLECCKVPTKSQSNLFKSLYDYYYCLKTLRGIIKKHQLEILVGFTTTVNILTILAGRRAGIPTIVSERNNPEVYRLSWLWERLRNKIYPKTQLLVVQNQGIKNYFSQIMPSSKIKILANPVAAELQERLQQSTTLPRERIILSVGRLDNNKGQDIALKAFAHLQSKDWQLVLVGDGENKTQLQQWVSHHHLEDRVVFAGKQTDVATFYQKAAVFLFTSRSEGFPNALIEAMYFGLPVVSTNCPYGPGELITHGKDGFLAPVDDVTAITEHLTALVQDASLRKVMGHEAHQTAKKMEIAQVAQTWMDQITLLLQ